MRTRTLWMLIIVIWVIAIAFTNSIYQHGLGKWAKSYISVMNQFIPLDKYASKSSFPDAARIYHAIIWWTFPFFWVISYRYTAGLDGVFIKPRNKISFWEFLKL